MRCYSARPRELHTDHQIRVISAGLPVDADFHPWTLGFKQSSLHLIRQPLRSLLGHLQLAARRFPEMLCSQARFPCLLTQFGL